MAACKSKGKPKFADGGLVKKEKNERPVGGKQVDMYVVDKKTGKEDRNKSSALRAQSVVHSANTYLGKNKDTKKQTLSDNKSMADSHDKKASEGYPSYKGFAVADRAANKVMHKLTSPKGGRGVRGKDK